METKRADAAEEVAKEAYQRVEALQRSLGQEDGLLAGLLSRVNDDHAAIVAAVVGVFAVGGPMMYVRFFNAAAGSAVGGVLLASCVQYVLAGDDTWLAALLSVVKGGASLLSWAAMACVVALGLLRFYLGWEWLVYATVDDMYMNRPMVNGFLSAPLIGGGAGKSGNADAKAATNGHADDELLERLVDLTRSAFGAAQASPRGVHELYEQYWHEVAQELNEGEAPPSDAVLDALMDYGYVPDDPGRSSPPPLDQLLRVLEDLSAGAGQHHRDNGYQAPHHPAAMHSGHAAYPSAMVDEV